MKPGPAIWPAPTHQASTPAAGPLVGRASLALVGPPRETTPTVRPRAPGPVRHRAPGPRL
jgi:hypothetical protein